MRKFLVAAILAVGIFLTGVKAAAADFYFVGSSDMDHISILDPSTIGAAQGGHKTFHLVDISEFYLWNDTGMEVDCVGKRARMISIVTHLSGNDSLDNSSQNSDVNVWHALVAGLEVGGVDLVQAGDLVCKYPDQKPTGDMVWDFPDFQSALERISTIIMDKQKGK